MAEKSAQLDKREVKDVEQVERTRSGKVFIPPVDIIENEKDIILTVDMPGAEEKSINVTLENDILIITGDVEPVKFNGYQPVYREYDSGDYQRSFTLTDSIDQDKIEANYKNGELTVKLPKTEPAKPKKIAVNAG